MLNICGDGVIRFTKVMLYFVHCLLVCSRKVDIIVLIITVMCCVQALRRSKLRTTRLHEAVHELRHSATRCKDLDAWLAQMHSLLTSRDGHTIPHDEKAIEALISEHHVNSSLHLNSLAV